MTQRLQCLVTIAVFCLLLPACATASQRSQPTATVAAGPVYALQPVDGWHVAGYVTVHPAPNVDHVLTIAVTGPSEEITRKFMWLIAAVACGEFGTFAQYQKPKLYFPGTKVERSRVFYRLEDQLILDSDRRSLSITAKSDWTIEPFSVSAFVNVQGTGHLVTCTDLPALAPS